MEVKHIKLLLYRKTKLEFIGFQDSNVKGGRKMNDIINSVFEKKDAIISKTRYYQELNTKNAPHEHAKEYRKLCVFFDSNFSDDEIMVVQSIMYFGRECYTGSANDYPGSKYDVIACWMNHLFFSFGKKINREIEIGQMVEKGLKIYTYFQYGFNELERR